MSMKKPMDTAEKAAWIGLVSVVLGAVIAGIFGLIKISDSLSVKPSPAQTATAVTRTSTTGTTPTGVTTVGVTPSPTSQPAIGSYTFNHELSCNACGNPILVTITQVTIDPTNENMTWNLKLVNRIATDATFNFDTFTLTDSS